MFYRVLGVWLHAHRCGMHVHCLEQRWWTAECCGVYMRPRGLNPIYTDSEVYNQFKPWSLAYLEADIHVYFVELSSNLDCHKTRWNCPLFAMCCAMAAIFFAPTMHSCICEFGHLMHIINFKGNYSYHGLNVCLFEFEHKDHCQLRYWLFLYYFNLDLYQKAERQRPPLPQY